MSNFLKTAIIVTGIIAASAAPAQAADYKLKLIWDDAQSVEQNYNAVSDKIEFYCKIQVRRDARLRAGERASATSHCQTQLMTAYVKRTDNSDLTKYFAARTHPSKGKVSAKGAG